jgi:hypothetical protein
MITVSAGYVKFAQAAAAYQKAAPAVVHAQSALTVYAGSQVIRLNTFLLPFQG